jgi:hypothetical protein
LRIASSAFAVAPLFSPMAFAGDEQDGRSIVTHLFESADADGSGALDPDEYETARLSEYGVSFEACDRDTDGRTTLEEYLELCDRHHPPRHPPGHGV